MLRSDIDTQITIHSNPWPTQMVRSDQRHRFSLARQLRIIGLKCKTGQGFPWLALAALDWQTKGEPYPGPVSFSVHSSGLELVDIQLEEA